MDQPLKHEEFPFVSSADGITIACYRWPAKSKARGVLQLSHGMGEHAPRYAPLAEFLASHGFHTYANDHRGHGRTGQPINSLGDFGKAGWNGLVDDMASLTKLIRSREPGLPMVLLGHSMGSFALQQYLLDYGALIDGAVISGSASLDKLDIDTSKPADLSAFNQRFEPARTPYDWLSRDPEEVDKYVADPLCGFGVNPKSLQSMVASHSRVIDLQELQRIRSDLPIWILAGDEDPINNDLEWLKPLAERYRAAGLKNVSEEYYRHGRHEMLNETNRAEVFNDLLAWLNSCLSP